MTGARFFGRADKLPAPWAIEYNTPAGPVAGLSVMNGKERDHTQQTARKLRHVNHALSKQVA